MLFCFLLAAVPSTAFASEIIQHLQLKDHLSVGIESQRLIGSHTSYEFGNPLPPNQAPLSRLEFPLDSWWAGGQLRASFPRFSLGAEALTNVSSGVDGHMKDSDWDDDLDPRRKTIYSESKCNMNPSYIVRTDIDLKVSDWLGLPRWLDLRPVAGFRWQDFNLVAHDGVQYNLEDGESAIPLPGDGIAFEQTYWQYFLGMQAGFELGKYVKLKSLVAQLRCDWAYVEGHNRDHHLLRDGKRYTYENTYGQAWHGSIGLKAGLIEHLSLALQADFLAISTTGSHRLVNSSFGIDRTWSNGVRVWSDQNSLSLMLQYAF